MSYISSFKTKKIPSNNNNNNKITALFFYANFEAKLGSLLHNPGSSPRTKKHSYKKKDKKAFLLFSGKK
jgi:hypothetical protein